MTVTDARLRVRPIEADDEAEVVALLTAALGGAPTGTWNADFFRWKHRGSPFGHSPGLVAADGDRIVGVRLFLRWQLQAAGRRLKAVRAVDTATHPDYRGRGIFRLLTLELLRQLDEVGEVDLVFNTPNGNSGPGYLKMGWQQVGVLPMHIGVHRPLTFARGARAASATTAISPRGHLDAVTPPHVQRLRSCTLPTADVVLTDRAPEVVRLLDEVPPPSGLHTPRSLEYLQWRYGRAPGLDYRCFVVEDHGRLVGLGIGRLRPRGALAELTLSELLVAGGDRRTTRRLLTVARRSGADHVAVHLPQKAERLAAAQAGYLRVPRYGLGLVTNPRTELPLDATDLRSWQLSLGDLEVF